MSEKNKKNRVNRREFLKNTALAGAAIGISGSSMAGTRQCCKSELLDPAQFNSNISSFIATPKGKYSMPGLFPGVVTEVHHPGVTEGREVKADIAATMLDQGMLNLTGAASVKEAWQLFIQPEDCVGIKINPLGGKNLPNTHSLIEAIISNLEAIGVPKKNIIIWDRFEDQMINTSYTSERFPGIECIGMSYVVNEDGKEVWKGEDRLDKKVFYEFDLDAKYEKAMEASENIHGGTKSYFPEVLTKRIDKVINVPVLKDHWLTFSTLALKNLAFGSVSNNSRGHKIASRFVAEVPACPVLRDKTVLNIVDGFRACYKSGPAPRPAYIWNPNLLYLATDPVAVDTLATQVILDKQKEAGIAKAEDMAKIEEKLGWLPMAENLGLGVHKGKEIDHRKVKLS